MDWSLNPEEERWQASARILAVRDFAPRAAEFDRHAAFPYSNFDALHEAGFLGLAVPETYGGSWCGYIPYALAALEIAAGDASTMCMLSMHFGCVFHVLTGASPEQRERYLSQVVRDGRFFGVATADSSSDSPGTKGEVRAERHGSRWRLRGRRHFVTGAGAADWLIVRASEADGTSHTFVVAQKETPGVWADRVGEGIGLRGSATHNVVFEDCMISDDDHIAGGMAFHEIGFYPVAGFSLGLSATVLGPAMAAYNFTRDLLKQTADAGSASAVSQERRRLLAEMHVVLEGARSLLLKAAWIADNQPSDLTVAVQGARFACTQGAVYVTQKAMLACGGRAYLDRYPLERHLRDALAGPLQAGCHESCPERMAAELLEL